MKTDLSTTYLGLALAHPVMPGASPMSDDLDTVRSLEDAGASAIVMHSLFEEQIRQDEREAMILESESGSFSKSVSYLPNPGIFALAPDEYLEQIQRIRRAVSIPVIASLNGTTPQSWIEYARLIEHAGAHALEINVYYVPTDPREDAEDVERRTIETAEAVKNAGGNPVAVKLSPFYSSFANFASRLDAKGVDGIVLFNRFYQPDIDVEKLDVFPTVRLSDSGELLLRLRWLAILSGRTRASLAVTGGVHTTARRREGRDGGGSRGSDGVGALKARPRASPNDRGGDDGVARGARVRIAASDAGEHEPRQERQPGGARAIQLHAGAAELEKGLRR